MPFRSGDTDDKKTKQKKHIFGGCYSNSDYPFSLPPFMGFSFILSISFARSTRTLFPTQGADSGDNSFDNERPQIASGFLFF